MSDQANSVKSLFLTATFTPFDLKAEDFDTLNRVGIQDTLCLVEPNKEGFKAASLCVTALRLVAAAIDPQDNEDLKITFNLMEGTGHRDRRYPNVIDSFHTKKNKVVNNIHKVLSALNANLGKGHDLAPTVQDHLRSLEKMLATNIVRNYSLDKGYGNTINSGNKFDFDLLQFSAGVAVERQKIVSEIAAPLLQEVVPYLPGFRKTGATGALAANT